MDQWWLRIRSAIIRSSRLSLVRTVYRKACQLGTLFVGRSLARMRGVDAVYVRHSHPRFVTFAPGESDLDLTIVLDDNAVQEPALVNACTEKIDALSGVIPFVFPQDARVTSRRELAQMEVRPGAAEILTTPRQWTRIGGREVRRAEGLPVLAADQTPMHPEFTSWWRNVLQTHVLTPQKNPADSSMRQCFRVAMKSQLHMQIARGRVPVPEEAYLPDSASASLFAEDPEMAELLGGLARDNFCASDSEARKVGILHRSLALAGNFYRQLPVPSDAGWMTPCSGRVAALDDAHRVDLRARLDGEETLGAIAHSIIVYPTPHRAPREYQIDVILRDDVPRASFADAVRTIKYSLGGRTFGIAGSHAQITLIPRIAFEHPLYLLGTPFPFLHEHLANYAETLLGAPPRLPEPPSRAERLRWCAKYFLYHRFTLRYRPRYVSKDCNFSQLAAIRLHLENGAVMTTAEEVRRAFVTTAEETLALDFLMRADHGPSDEVPIGAMLALQSREYDAVEALLRHAGALS
jgi:hypothetical protein